MSWEKLLDYKSPCYGIVIFDLTTDPHKCVIVKTKSGNTGFPKGKAEKNKLTNVIENFFEGASRELLEEVFGQKPNN